MCLCVEIQQCVHEWKRGGKCHVHVPGGARCGVCVTIYSPVGPGVETFIRARYPQSKKNVNVIDQTRSRFRLTLCSQSDSVGLLVMLYLLASAWASTCALRFLQPWNNF